MKPATAPLTPPAPPAQPRTLRVWDALVRLVHWTLVSAVALAWLTAEDGRVLHEAIGYAALGAIGLRLVWGFVGPRYARFAQFVRAPQVVQRYAVRVARRDAPRYVGHNPLGGWMVLALLATLAAVGLTGWLMTLDAFFGDEWLEELHEGLASGMLVLIGLHVAGVVLTSLQHGENLVRAMIDGRKRAPAAGDVS